MFPLFGIEFKITNSTRLKIQRFNQQKNQSAKQPMSMLKNDSVDLVNQPADLIFTERKPDLKFIRNYQYNFINFLQTQNHTFPSFVDFLQNHPNFRLNIIQAKPYNSTLLRKITKAQVRDKEFIFINYQYVDLAQCNLYCLANEYMKVEIKTRQLSRAISLDRLQSIFKEKIWFIQQDIFSKALNLRVFEDSEQIPLIQLRQTSKGSVLYILDIGNITECLKVVEQLHKLNQDYSVSIIFTSLKLNQEDRGEIVFSQKFPNRNQSLVYHDVIIQCYKCSKQLLNQLEDPKQYLGLLNGKFDSLMIINGQVYYQLNKYLGNQLALQFLLQEHLEMMDYLLEQGTQNRQVITGQIMKIVYENNMNVKQLPINRSDLEMINKYSDFKFGSKRDQKQQQKYQQQNQIYAKLNILTKTSLDTPRSVIYEPSSIPNYYNPIGEKQVQDTALFGLNGMMLDLDVQRFILQNQNITLKFKMIGQIIEGGLSISAGTNNFLPFEYYQKVFQIDGFSQHEIVKRHSYNFGPYFQIFTKDFQSLNVINAEIIKGTQQLSTYDYYDKLKLVQVQQSKFKQADNQEKSNQDIIRVFFSLSGPIYEHLALLNIISILENTKSLCFFYFIDQVTLSPDFKKQLASLQQTLNFGYEFIYYQWPQALYKDFQSKRQIYGSMILFLDLIFTDPGIERIIYMDADQIVKTDLKILWETDLDQKPYALVPHCNAEKSFEKSPFWFETLSKNDKDYYFSGVFVANLTNFRVNGYGNILRKNYQYLEFELQMADNLQLLDQDLINYSQFIVPIKSLGQEWLWCEAWCNKDQQDEALIVDLCGDPFKYIGENKIDKFKRLQPLEFDKYSKILNQSQ
ncbi:udp-glucose:glycoprotein glucosyltransferase [Stylonychia lemnae]|uniref:Udp-glucose:glycoprotein glucosyltransferase n=1 Tax=Stylonychia lemnae TaxID=5949 RepID=A0A078AJ00_STYLE|nr:udp-glucose:glycoprotein glucosyltransferase [Stylonychia lemnae]|eukprot:CDW81437.1 udp-glucose:glycoprotein glucosyltransferase [Stylonychia lemnae]